MGGLGPPSNNFNPKTDSEMETHIEEYKVTHFSSNYNQHIQQVDMELLKISDRGFISATFQTSDKQSAYLNRSVH